MQKNQDLTYQEKLDLLDVLEKEAEHKKYNKIDYLWPKEGALGRDKFKKQIAAINATKDCETVIVFGCNRGGKTYTACQLAVILATGIYPDWYDGRKFREPITMWFVGTSLQKLRTNIQTKLCGKIHDIGSGILRKSDYYCPPKKKLNVPDAFETIYIKHHTDGIFDGVSDITFFSSDQNLDAFKGDEVHVAIIDEATKQEQWVELGTRVATKDGLRALFFTPDRQGEENKHVTTLVLSLMDEGLIAEGKTTIQPPIVEGDKVVDKGSNRYVTTITWDDIPFEMLSRSARASAVKDMTPSQIQAKCYGNPFAGDEQIFNFPDEDILYNPFEIPNFWPKVYGMDVGFSHPTAVIWLALDPISGVIYAYREYAAKRAEPATHAFVIRKGQNNETEEWMHGVVDDHANARMQDGRLGLFSQYKELGLNLHLAKHVKDINARNHCVYQYFATGKLKIASNLNKLRWQLRLYRFDENGKPPEKDDDLVDALVYAITSGLRLASIDPKHDTNYRPKNLFYSPVNARTGY